MKEEPKVVRIKAGPKRPMPEDNPARIRIDPSAFRFYLQASTRIGKNGTRHSWRLSHGMIPEWMRSGPKILNKGQGWRKKARRKGRR